MRISKTALILCAIFVICALQAVMLRDLSPVNELNTVAIAKSALTQGRLFYFDEEAYGAQAAGPLYYWVCMAGLAIEGSQASVFLLSLNLALFIAMLLCLERTFSPLVMKSFSGAGIISIIAMPYVASSVFMARGSMIYCFLLCLSACFLAARTQQVLADPAMQSVRGRVALPILLILLTLDRGLFGAVIPPLCVLIVLIVKCRARAFLRVYKPWWLLCPLGAFAIWGAMAFLEGGRGYFTWVFIDTPINMLTGAAGHDHGLLWLLAVALMLSLPQGPCFAYAAVRTLLTERSQIPVRALYCAALPLAVVVVCAIPQSKGDTSLLPALPTLSYFLVNYFEKNGCRDIAVKVLLTAGFLPFSALLAACYFLNDDFALLNGVFVVTALSFIVLFTVLAVFKTINADGIRGLSAFGAGVMAAVLALGFAMPRMNAYLSPAQAVRTIAEHSTQSGIRKVCVAGIPHSWTLSLASPRLTYREKGTLEMLRDECVRSYRLIGRGALRDHPEYDPLRRLPGAYMVGDSLVVDPAAPRFVRKNGERRWY
ncbi:MAG: hypothetical protein SOT14_00085 [Succinivibrio sp.]|nr:hypothetical protein [Succinivibrio sp.]